MEWRLDCEECDNTSYVTTGDQPEFCPCCGRRCEAEPTRDLDWMDHEDE